MTHQKKQEWRQSRHHALRHTDPAEMLDVLLALDRMLVEVSMRLYKVPRCEQFTMRKHNRRLHAAMRQHLPQLLTSPRVRA